LFANIHYNFKNNHIYLWEYDKNGQRNLIEEQYKPYCFVKDKNGTYKDLFGNPCRLKEFDDYYAQKEYVKNYPTYEGDIDPDSRFLIDRYHDVDLLANLPPLCIHIIDIETRGDEGFPKSSNIKDEILCITIFSTHDKKFHTFGTQPYSGKEETEYIHCSDEKDLLKQYFKWHRSHYPDVITGWYVDKFDIPYIMDRAIMLFGEIFMKKYSPVNEVEIQIGETYKDYRVSGISILDYKNLYSKYTMNEQESYSLNYISKVELGKEKLKYEGSLADLWRDDWTKFIDYNIHDVQLVKELDERLGFITLTQVQSYFSRVPMNKIDSSIRKFDNYLLTILKPLNIVLPTSVRKEKVEIPGGYVADVCNGFFKNIVSFDFLSLYPHIMFALNLSPETYFGKIIPVNKTKHKILADNEIMYTNIDLQSIVDGEDYILEVYE
jgi:DNA polymerase elongation subunit (family B)